MKACFAAVMFLFAAMLYGGETAAVESDPPAKSIPAEVQQFVRQNLKGCTLVSSRVELKTNAVLARLMSDLYKSRYEYHFELRDARGDDFKVRLQDFSKIERFDDCRMRVAELPDAVQKRLQALDAAIRWDELCEAKKEDARFVRYELKGRKENRKVRAALLHDGTVVSFPGVKDERPTVELDSPARAKFIEESLTAPRN